MDVQGIISQARDAITVKRAFGEAYEKDGVTVIPVAKVQGGAGGGDGKNAQGQETGTGSGFGLAARPVGTYLIRGNQVSWHPAIDVNRIVLGGQIMAVAAMLSMTVRAIVNTRARGRAAAAQRSLLATAIARQRRGRPIARWRRMMMDGQRFPLSGRRFRGRAGRVLSARLQRGAPLPTPRARRKG